MRFHQPLALTTGLLIAIAISPTQAVEPACGISYYCYRSMTPGPAPAEPQQLVSRDNVPTAGNGDRLIRRPNTPPAVQTTNGQASTAAQRAQQQAAQQAAQQRAAAQRRQQQQAQQLEQQRMAAERRAQQLADQQRRQTTVQPQRANNIPAVTPDAATTPQAEQQRLAAERRARQQADQRRLAALRRAAAQRAAQDRNAAAQPAATRPVATRPVAAPAAPRPAARPAVPARTAQSCSELTLKVRELERQATTYARTHEADKAQRMFQLSATLRTDAKMQSCPDIN